MRKTDPAPGDRVTCRYPVSAYYSNYGGNPVMTFAPGMVGVVASIAPKVKILRRIRGYDQREDFVVVDYDCPVTGQSQRVGLDFCNTVLVPQETKP